jgi:hypothetical protein
MSHQLVIDKFEYFIISLVSIFDISMYSNPYFNVELKGLIDDLTEKARTAKQLTLKERIEEQINDAR